MSENAPGGSVSEVLGFLGNIGGSVAVVIAYLLALSGRTPGPFSNTTAIITVLLTTVVVWVWRASRITRRQSQPLEATGGYLSIATSAGQAPAGRLIDPFFSRGNPPYALPLRRRRIELACLAALTLATTAWSSSRVSAAIREFTTPQPSATREYTCMPAIDAQGLRVVIADFEEGALQPAAAIENRLYDAMTADVGRGRVICRLQRVVGTRQQAQELGRELHAALVVWGRSDAIFEVHLELANGGSTGWAVPGVELPPLPAEALADFQFAMRQPSVLSFFTDFVLSQVLYLGQDTEGARQLLGSALSRAEAQALAQNNAGDLGDAYFQLGFLYDPQVDPARPDEERALNAYTRALELNQDLQAARLNRGNLYAHRGQVSLAIADFDKLIAGHTPAAAVAAANRANLQTERGAAERDFALAIQLDPATGYFERGWARRFTWNDLPGAAADFAEVVKIAPSEYVYYQVLGETQLLAGQVAAARETYHAVVALLDASARQSLIDGLEEVARQKPEVAADVTAIVADLRAAVLQ